MNKSIECRGTRRASPEAIKRDGWRHQGILAVDAADPRLSWDEKALLEALGRKLYGDRAARTSAGCSAGTTPQDDPRTPSTSPRT